MARYTTTTTTTTTRRPSLMQRLRGHRTRRTTRASHPHATTHTHNTRATAAPVHHTRATAAPVHHHRRKTSIGDKISGGLMRLKGSLTRRPGVKAAGTRRMHGTDGRGSHHHRY